MLTFVTALTKSSKKMGLAKNVASAGASEEPVKGSQSPESLPIRLREGLILKGQYRLESELGTGGMGVVFKARDLLMEEMKDREPYVAIKILRPEYRDNQQVLMALQREFRKAQKLSHPNIVGMMNFTRDDDLGIVFIIMQYLEGKTLADLESLSGIPGTVGGSPIQNIGAYGHEVSETIARVRAFDRKKSEVVTFTNQMCNFSYRNSIFKEESGRYVILSVTFQLRKGELSQPISYAELAKYLSVNLGDKAPVGAVRRAVLELRGGKGMLIDTKDQQILSAGSFFINPILSKEIADKLPADAPRWPQSDGKIKISAAWLMEHAGVTKGEKLAGAQISSKHVLALTNSGNATANDIVELAKMARDKVFEKFGIKLQAEVQLVGLDLN